MRGDLGGSALPRDTFDDDGIGEDDGHDGHDVKSVYRGCCFSLALQLSIYSCVCQSIYQPLCIYFSIYLSI